jgi:2'-5' RNA ligase
MRQFVRGVISTLDTVYYNRVEEIWDELDALMALSHIREVPFPHMTWHVAEEYKTPELNKCLEQLSKQLPPFEIRTSGLGIFTGEKPTLYIPVIRDSHLTIFHKKIWEIVEQASSKSNLLYTPPLWIPHITLVSHNDLDIDKLLKALKLLAGRDFNWIVEIDNLCLGAYMPGNKGELECGFPLKGEVVSSIQ